MGVDNTPLKGIRLRLYPTVKQQMYLSRAFGCSRLVFNQCLTKSKSYYAEHKKAINLSILGHYFHQELTKNPTYVFLKEHNTKVMKQEILDLLVAYKHFFIDGYGFPSYKFKTDVQSLRFPIDAISKKTITENSRLNLTKQLHGVKFRCSNRDKKYVLNGLTVIKSVTIVKEKDLRYYASVIVSFKPDLKEANNYSVGIDFGIKSFATLSNGFVYNNNRFYVRQEQKIKYLCKELSRKHRGSSNRRKAILAIARASAKIKRQRSDYIHKMTTKIINDNQVVIIESLNIKGMLKNHCLAKHIQDVSISEAVRQLKYKSFWYGRHLVEVDRWFASSKLCSSCGYKKKDLTLSDRVFSCPHCGLSIDRDLNAALNLKKEGIRLIQEALPWTKSCGEDVRPADPLSAGSLRETGKKLYFS